MSRVLRTILFVLTMLVPLTVSGGAEVVCSSGTPAIGHEQVSLVPMEDGCAGMPCMADCSYAACAVSACSLQHVGLATDTMPLVATIPTAIADAEAISDGQRLLPDKPPPRA